MYYFYTEAIFSLFLYTSNIKREFLLEIEKGKEEHRRKSKIKKL